MMAGFCSCWQSDLRRTQGTMRINVGRDDRCILKLSGYELDKEKSWSQGSAYAMFTALPFLRNRAYADLAVLLF